MLSRRTACIKVGPLCAAMASLNLTMILNPAVRSLVLRLRRTAVSDSTIINMLATRTRDEAVQCYGNLPA